MGVDMLEIERMERALERRPRLAERLFTPAERARELGGEPTVSLTHTRVVAAAVVVLA